MAIDAMNRHAECNSAVLMPPACHVHGCHIQLLRSRPSPGTTQMASIGPGAVRHTLVAVRDGLTVTPSGLEWGRNAGLVIDLQGVPRLTRSGAALLRDIELGRSPELPL